MKNTPAGSTSVILLKGTVVKRISYLRQTPELIARKLTVLRTLPLLSWLILMLLLTDVVAQSTSPNIVNVNTAVAQQRLPAFSSQVITFSEFATGTKISTQYNYIGLVFSGSGPFISQDASNPTSPILSGTPQFEGDIVGTFVVPGTNQPTIVQSFTFDAGYFDSYGSTRIEWFDPEGNKLGQRINSILGIETITIDGGNIASWKISIVENEPAGFGIDNVSFVAKGPSVLFREGSDDRKQGTWEILGDEIPGFDHVGFHNKNIVYESHPGYVPPGVYTSADGSETRNITLQNGVQFQHSLNTFKHDAKVGNPSHVENLEEIPIEQDLADKMTTHIKSVDSYTFGQIIFDDLDGITQTLSPAIQKGGKKTFTCVGLVEWASEKANHNGGQGFIPNFLESFKVPDLSNESKLIEVPLLSPQLLNYCMKAEELVLNAKQWLQGLFDPVDFLITDPLGRRLGYVKGLGSFNEIPNAFYPGNGDLEQFLIPNALPGTYKIDITGTGDSTFGSVAGLGASQTFLTYLNSGEVQKKKITLAPNAGSTGDVNGDASVDSLDVDALIPLLNTFTNGLGHPGDLDGDGLLSITDLNLLKQLIGILTAECNLDSLTLGNDKIVYKDLPDSSCIRLSIEGLSADTSGYTFLWNTGNTSSSITVCPDQTTDYSITVTSGSCTFTDTIKVVVKNFFITNKAPVVIITFPADNKVYTAPATIIINAAASDSDGTVKYVKFYNGGSFLRTDSTFPYTCTLTNLQAGSYSFVAKATDDFGLTSSSASVAVKLLSTANKAPLVTLTSPLTDGIYTAPAIVTLTATAADPDGTISYVKFYNGGTLLNTDSVSPYTFTLTNVQAANYSLVAKATDNNGLTSSSASVAIAVSVPTNKAPVVKITNPVNDAVLNAPASITLTATASDVDGSITNVKFYRGATLLKIDSASPYNYTFNNPAPGTYSFISAATDNKGLSASSASVTITVLAAQNSAPVVNITSPGKNAVFSAPATIILNADATDADGTISYVKFYRGGTLLKTDSTIPFSYTLSNVAAGSYSFIATATDNKGLFASSASTTVSVQPNKKPVVIITSPADSVVYFAPASFEVAAVASDSDGTIKYVEFYSGTTLLGRDSSRPYSFTLNNAGPAVYVITAIAADNKGLITTSAPTTVIVKANGTLEAEDAVLSGAVIGSSVPGFTGSGYADFVHNSSDYIEWSAKALHAGSFTLSFRYANGGPVNRPLQVQVNGVVVDASLDFASTGGWATWSVSSLNVNLVAGINKIRLTAIGLNGPNVDNLTMIANTGTLEAEDALLVGAVASSTLPGFTGSGYGDYTKSSGEYIEWTLDAASSGAFLLQFRYANGGSSDRPLQLQINGTVVNATVKFVSTGGWATWAVSSVSTSLIAGPNKIRLSTIGFNGSNIDNLTYTLVNPVLASRRYVHNETVVTKTPDMLLATLSPNPAKGTVKLTFSTSSQLPVSAQVIDMSGRNYTSLKFLNKGTGTFDFSVSELPAGSYIVVIRQGRVNVRKKLLVIK